MNEEEKTLLDTSSDDTESTSLTDEIKVVTIEGPAHSHDDSIRHNVPAPQKEGSGWKNRIKDVMLKMRNNYAKRHVFTNIVLSLYLLLSILSALFAVFILLIPDSIDTNHIGQFCFEFFYGIVGLLYLMHTFLFVGLNQKEAVFKSFIDMWFAFLPLTLFYILFFTAEPDEGEDYSLLATFILNTIIVGIIAGIVYKVMKCRKYGATAWTLLDVPRSGTRRGINFMRILKVGLISLGIVLFGYIILFLFNHLSSPNNRSDDYKQAEDARIGDYYYEDGTLSSELLTDKKCVGIVYSLETSDFEKEQGFYHGHIIAMEDASAEKNEWDRLNEDKDWIPNYTWENRREALTDRKGLDYYNQPYIDVYKPCLELSKAEGASYWYVPTPGEWTEILRNLGHVEVSSMLSFDAETAAKYLDIININPNKWYWVMAEQDAENAWSIRIASGEFGSRTPKTNKAYIRPVAAF